MVTFNSSTQKTSDRQVPEFEDSQNYTEKQCFEEEIKGGKNNVILFDQIENDVDKPFISDVLRELIEDTKGYVQIIIVTHDPIVAVNADPTNYIECIRDKDKFYYRSFCPECDDKDELNTIAKNVDGSKEVIKNRNQL